MMKFKNILLLIVLMFFSTTIFAQNPATLKNWELKQYAKNAMLKNDYVMSLLFYNELLLRKPNNSKIKYQVALLNFKIRDYEKSRDLFLDIYNKSNNKHSEALYFYAENSRILGDYSTAEIYFTNFIDNCNDKKHVELLHLSELALQGIGLSKDTNFIENYYVHNLNKTINTPHLESSPIIINDTSFIYSSFGIDSVKIINSSSQTCPKSSYRYAKLVNNDWVGGGSPPAPFFNIPNQSTANGAFSLDKKRFYFSVKELNDRGLQVSQLFVTELINNVWSEPVKLGNKINLPFFNSTQPTVGSTYLSNLEIIYFVSDRSGGWGGKDIWFSVYDKIHQTYTEPTNAGGYINTLGDEMTPFYDADNKIMYFSSNGLVSFGGFDVFKTIGELANWVPAQNIESPINSSFDEFYFSINKNEPKGFFISNRTEALDWGNENCCFDIFSFDMQYSNNLIITGQLVVPDATVFNSINKLLTNSDSIADSSNLYIENAIVDLKIHNIVDSSYVTLFSDTTDNNGRFSFTISRGYDFSMTVNSQGYSFSSCNFSSDYDFQDTVNLDCINVEPNFDKNIVLENILFEFNSATLTESSVAYIDSVIVPVLMLYNEIIVEIGAHTDKVGDTDYNLQLSQDRAQAVVDRIVAAGIPVSRIMAKGYGETKPRMCETFADGSDNASSRQQNRRVEFKILGFIQ
ncbi:MAG: OmpA family protein [Bacteroidales bacterium]|nr:OmpA family protein [Bacteroidales bacterium]